MCKIFSNFSKFLCVEIPRARFFPLIEITPQIQPGNHGKVKVTNLHHLHAQKITHLRCLRSLSLSPSIRWYCDLEGFQGVYWVGLTYDWRTTSVSLSLSDSCTSDRCRISGPESIYTRSESNFRALVKVSVAFLGLSVVYDRRPADIIYCDCVMDCSTLF